jgi:hypothetical protein
MRLWATRFIAGSLAAGALLGGCQEQKMTPAAATQGLSQQDPSQSPKAKKKGWFDDWGKPKPKPEAATSDGTPAAPPSPAPSQARKPADPRPAPLYAVQLEVFQLDVPHRSVSTNGEFWKRVNEDAVDVTTHDLLLRNGFRVGQAAIAEWDYFRDLLNRNPVKTQRSTYVAYQAKQVELLVRKEVPARNVFVFGSAGDLVGRSFGDSDYEMQLSFWPTPRKNGEVHVKLLPVVRGRSRKWEKFQDGDDEGVRLVTPERLYDLKLEADVTPGSFLIIAPSQDFRQTTSLGNAFMVDEHTGDRVETVLIFVARAFGEAPLPTTTQPASGG